MVQNSISSTDSPYSIDTFILYEYCFFFQYHFQVLSYQADVVKTVKIHIIQGAPAIFGLFETYRKNNTTQLKSIQFYCS